MSRISIAYIFWAIGGIFGLHHLYLGRLSHAIFFNLTFGFFGLGFIYDFFHIPKYVKQANSDPIYLGLLRKKIKTRPAPSIARAIGFYVSTYCSSHISLALIGPLEPIEARIGDVITSIPLWWVVLSHIIQSIGILIGALTVNNIGGQRTVSKSYLYLAVIVGTMVDAILASISQPRIFVMCRILFPTLFYLRSVEWLPTCATPKPRYFTTITRFTKLFLQYLISSLIVFSFIFGSLYFYCDLFVGNDGRIEYSDTNYGLGFNHEDLIAPNFWALPTFAPQNPQISSSSSPYNVNTDIMSSGNQPQYSYTQFKDELNQFYKVVNSQNNQNHIENDKNDKNNKNDQTNTNPPPTLALNELSLPYSYRFRDVLRNVYFSSILQPVHSVINYYNTDYKPGFVQFYPVVTNLSGAYNKNDRYVHHPLQTTSSPSIFTLINILANECYYRLIFIIRCLYYFVINSYNYLNNNVDHTHTIDGYIKELDVQGLQWSKAYLTFINNGNSIDNNDSTIANIVVNFITNQLQTVNGDVTKLGYWSQRAIYDAIVAYGRYTAKL